LSSTRTGCSRRRRSSSWVITSRRSRNSRSVSENPQSHRARPLDRHRHCLLGSPCDPSTMPTRSRRPSSSFPGFIGYPTRTLDADPHCIAVLLKTLKYFTVSYHSQLDTVHHVPASFDTEVRKTVLSNYLRAVAALEAEGPQPRGTRSSARLGLSFRTSTPWHHKFSHTGFIPRRGPSSLHRVLASSRSASDIFDVLAKDGESIFS